MNQEKLVELFDHLLDSEYAKVFGNLRYTSNFPSFQKLLESLEAERKAGVLEPLVRVLPSDFRTVATCLWGLETGVELSRREVADQCDLTVATVGMRSSGAERRLGKALVKPLAAVKLTFEELSAKDLFLIEVDMPVRLQRLLSRGFTNLGQLAEYYEEIMENPSGHYRGLGSAGKQQITALLTEHGLLPTTPA